MAFTSTQTFDGGQISAVQTQFYFENERLCYRIVFNYGETSSQIGIKFSKYDAYREAHESIITAMTNQGIYKPSAAA